MTSAYQGTTTAHAATYEAVSTMSTTPETTQTVFITDEASTSNVDEDQTTRRSTTITNEAVSTISTTPETTQTVFITDEASTSNVDEDQTTRRSTTITTANTATTDQESQSTLEPGNMDAFPSVLPSAPAALDFTTALTTTTTHSETNTPTHSPTSEPTSVVPTLLLTTLVTIEQQNDATDSHDVITTTKMEGSSVIPSTPNKESLSTIEIETTPVTTTESLTTISYEAVTLQSKQYIHWVFSTQQYQ